MRATAILCLCASALALAACPGPKKDDTGSAAPETNQVVDVKDVGQTGNVSTPIASGNKCCTGPTLGDSCIAMPAGGCPADKPVIVSEP